MATIEDINFSVRQKDLANFASKLAQMELGREEMHAAEESENINKIMERRVKALVPDGVIPGESNLDYNDTGEVTVTQSRPMPHKTTTEETLKLNPPSGDDIFTKFLNTIKG